MKAMPIAVGAFLQVVLLLSPPAYALDLSRFLDNNRTTVDTVTGLEWLDLTESLNLSYNDVAAQLSTGGMFEGYRYANTTEMEDLFNAFTLPQVPPDVDHDPTAGYSFINLFGQTNEIHNRDFDRISSFGMSAPYYYPTGAALMPLWGVQVTDQPRYGIGPSTSTYREPRAILPSSSEPYIGSFLVRDSNSSHAVPEIDGSTTPLALGLLSLLCLLRRENRKRFVC